MAGIYGSNYFFKLVVIVCMLLEVQNSIAICPPLCPTTGKEYTTEQYSPTTSPEYTTEQHDPTTLPLNSNTLQCFTCDSYQSSSDECGEEQTTGISPCQNGEWCFVSTVYRDSITTNDVLRYERGCWEEALCDNAAMNTDDNLINQACAQQNGTYVCHRCCNKDQCNSASLVPESGASLNSKSIVGIMMPMLNIILHFL
ncbi:uncharacterized protein LOC144867506 [Branchiostoma floridae x Branchiostoma japonicum]